MQICMYYYDMRFPVNAHVRKEEFFNKMAKKKVKRGSARANAKKAFRATAVASSAPIVIVEDDRGRALLQLRFLLGMNRETFSRLVPTSVRNLANIESGKVPSEVVLRRLKELRRVVDALSEVIKKDAVGAWLSQPNEAFDGFKPIEVVERGEVDRIWQMVYFLRSGVPS